MCFTAIVKKEQRQHERVAATTSASVTTRSSGTGSTNGRAEENRTRMRFRGGCSGSAALVLVATLLGAAAALVTRVAGVVALVRRAVSTRGERNSTIGSVSPAVGNRDSGSIFSAIIHARRSGEAGLGTAEATVGGGTVRLSERPAARTVWLEGAGLVTAAMITMIGPFE